MNSGLENPAKIFLGEIVNNGLYDMLKDVKIAFGNLIAVEACLQIYQTNDCDTVVRTYIPTPSNTISVGSPREAFQKLLLILAKAEGILKKMNQRAVVLANKIASKYPRIFKGN